MLVVPMLLSLISVLCFEKFVESSAGAFFFLSRAFCSSVRSVVFLSIIPIIFRINIQEDEKSATRDVNPLLNELAFSCT